MPGPERDLADTASDLATALLSLPTPILFRRGRVLVFPDLLPNHDGTTRLGLIPLLPAKARTFFSDYVEFWRGKYTTGGDYMEVTVTLSKSDAEGLLEADQLITQMPEIVALHPRPLPVFNAAHELILPAPGYDPATHIYTYPA